MTTQDELNLVVPRYPQVPASRRCDTSRAASVLAREKAEYLRPKVFAALRDKPMTGTELAESLDETLLNIRPRISELRAMGKVFATKARRFNPSGNPEIVWATL